MLLGIVLDAAMTTLLTTCAPAIGTQTMGGIVEHESSWKPWAIGDNTTHKAYFEDSQAQAIAKAHELLAQGDNLDAGLAQVNSDNFAAYGLTADTAFDPCRNVGTGAKILAENYASAVRQNWIGRPIATAKDVYEQEQEALIHSLSAYNSGKFWASMSYANTVYGLAENVRIAVPAASRIPTATTMAARTVTQTVYRPAALQQNAPDEPRWKAQLRTAMAAWTRAYPAAAAAPAAAPALRVRRIQERAVTFRPNWGPDRPMPSAARMIDGR